MGVFTIAARNLMLDAIGRGVLGAADITHVGLLDADPSKAITAVAATDIFTSNGHGYANGDLVILTQLVGGAGLQGGDANNANELARPYFVIGQTANTFQLSHTSGGAAVNFTTDVTGGNVIRLVELAGGAPAYARKAIAFAAAADGTMDDTTNGAVLDVPGGATVDYISYHDQLAAGGTLCAIDRVTNPEVYAGQGTYTVTDADLDLLAFA